MIVVTLRSYIVIRKTRAIYVDPLFLYTVFSNATLHLCNDMFVWLYVI